MDTTDTQDFFVHPTATIDQPCQIGPGTKVWHYTHVMKGAVIGDSCTIGQGVFVASNARLGNNVKVQNNVSVYEGVVCEDDVFLGPSMVFTNVCNPRAQISRRAQYQKTLVKRGATVGANATLLCGITVGEYAFIGAGAVVTREVPANALVLGNPARQTGWACKCGVKLGGSDGDPALQCAECGARYEVQDGQLRRAGEG